MVATGKKIERHNQWRPNLHQSGGWGTCLVSSGDEVEPPVVHTILSSSDFFRTRTIGAAYGELLGWVAG